MNSLPGMILEKEERSQTPERRKKTKLGRSIVEIYIQSIFKYTDGKRKSRRTIQDEG